MTALSHWDFVLAAYGLTALTLGGLASFVLLDYFRQKRAIAAAESEGRRGRSGQEES